MSNEIYEIICLIIFALVILSFILIPNSGINIITIMCGALSAFIMSKFVK